MFHVRLVVQFPRYYNVSGVQMCSKMHTKYPDVGLFDEYFKQHWINTRTQELLRTMRLNDYQLRNRKQCRNKIVNACILTRIIRPVTGSLENGCVLMYGVTVWYSTFWWCMETGAWCQTRTGSPDAECADVCCIFGDWILIDKIARCKMFTGDWCHSLIHDLEMLRVTCALFHNLVHDLEMLHVYWCMVSKSGTCFLEMVHVYWCVVSQSGT